MTFSCPDLDMENNFCVRLKETCVLGRPGCVLGGTGATYSDDVLQQQKEIQEAIDKRKKRRNCR